MHNLVIGGNGQTTLSSSSTPPAPESYAKVDNTSTNDSNLPDGSSAAKPASASSPQVDNTPTSYTADAPSFVETPSPTPTSVQVENTPTSYSEDVSSFVEMASGASAPSATISDVIDLATSSISGTASAATTSFTPSESSYNSRPPPFYVGVALGCLAVCAFIATLVAWYIRTRRRKRPVVPPWADKGYSFATTATEKKQKRRVHETLVGLGILIDEEIAVWEPRGDRDVGEPKWSKQASGTRQHENANTTAQDPPGYGAFEAVELTPRTDPYVQQDHMPNDHNNIPQGQSHVQQGHTPTSYNGTLQDQALAHRHGLGPLQVTNYITGDGRSSPSSSKVVPSPLTRTLASPGFRSDREELGTLRETPGTEKPRYTTLQAECPVPNPTQQHSDIPPLPYPGDQEAASPLNTQSWLKSAFGSLFTANSAVQDDGLSPAPQRHANANPLLPTHQSTDDMDIVASDSLVGMPSKPFRAHTRRRDRGREFEVGKLMSRPAIAARASSIYSTASLTSYASRRSVASVSSSVYSYYGYKKSKVQRTKSNASSSAQTATTGTAFSPMGRTMSRKASTRSGMRSKIPIQKKKVSTCSRRSSVGSSWSSKIPVRQGGLRGRVGSVEDREEMFARKTLLDRQERLIALKKGGEI